MTRRESTPLLEKVKIDASLLHKARAAVSGEREAEARRKAKEKKESEDMPVLNYLNVQVG